MRSIDKLNGKDKIKELIWIVLCGTGISVSNRDPCINIREKHDMDMENLFLDLKNYLTQQNLMPDEYFGLNLPDVIDIKDEEFEISCKSEWGGSEGIYLDVYLERGRTQIYPVITGKTLGETEADYDRMHYIAGEIYKYVHGTNGKYARYIRLGKDNKQDYKKTALSRIRESIRKKMYHAGAFIENINLKELGFFLIIFTCLQEVSLPKEKWLELIQNEEPMRLLYKQCEESMEATEYEIKDFLESCRRLRNK